MKFEFDWPNVSEKKMYENVDWWQTDEGVIGILIAYLRAYKRAYNNLDWLQSLNIFPYLMALFYIWLE